MNASFKAIFAIILMAYVGNVAAQLTVRQVTLEWEATAGQDGQALYNSLCSACHGVNGDGHGPAAGALHKDVPDLRMLAIDNDGQYSRKKVQRSIRGLNRDIAHGTIDMPDWEQQFMYVNFGWSHFTREAYARRCTQALSQYVETLQLDEPAGQVVASKP